MDQLRLFALKYDLLKISIDLQTVFAAETHLTERQWLKEQLNVVKLRMFRVGAQMLLLLTIVLLINDNNVINNNDNNLILIYLHANPTVQGPIAK
jgi:hypothetical protein